MNRGLGQGSQMKMNYEAKPASFFILFLNDFICIIIPLFHPFLLFTLKSAAYHNIVAELRGGLCVSDRAGVYVGYFVKLIWWLSP